MESKPAKVSSDDEQFFDTDDATAASKGSVEEAKLKKQSSYTYWVQNNKEQFPQHTDRQLIAPKKIEDPELLKQLEATAVSATTGSAWNKAGTW